ncbi:MAG: hypothetical protein AAGJ10_20490 [Bacteroidota bacterium]
MRYALFAGLLLAGSGLAGCQPESQSRGLPTMAFAVVDSLLAAPVAFEAGFTVRPPQGWQRDASRTGSALLKAKQPVASFFADSVGQGGMHTALIPLPGALTWTEQVAAYEAAHPELDDEQVRRAEFLKDGQPVLQHLIQQPDTVSFSLLMPLRADTALQTVYLLPTSEYTAITARSIESSIGSISIHVQSK